LGNGTKSEAEPPVAVVGVTSATDVAAGGLHSCALRSNGTVVCWGHNGEGQLGDGTTNHSDVPVEVIGVADASAVAAGKSHSCAVLGDGSVKCWGDNLHGQFGSRTNARFNPQAVEVRDISNVATLSYGGVLSGCAIRRGGALICWNDRGRLDILANPDDIISPPQQRLDGVTAVAAGDAHICAIDEKETVHCWGSNGSGQLGNGSGVDSDVPVPIGASVAGP
jgi:alpha-tubulin suppressor-like RCC1 family protein